MMQWLFGQDSPVDEENKKEGPVYSTQCSVGEEWALKEDELEVTSNELGKGGFTKVYEGTYRGHRVAVKTWEQELVADFGIVWQQEVDALSHVERSGGHDHIVHLWGAHVYWRYHARIVLELCSGGTLQDLLRRRAPQEQVMAIYIDVAKAIAWLHGLSPKIIHRDIKATNVFICEDGRCKLGDFGLAKMKRATHRRPGVSVSLVDLTSPSGTRLWMAPELLDDVEDYSEVVDSYSFGVMMLESCYPLFSMSAMQVPKEYIQSQFGRVERPLVPATSPLAALIEACISIDPNTRPMFPEIVQRLQKESVK